MKGMKGETNISQFLEILKLNLLLQVLGKFYREFRSRLRFTF